MINGITRSKPDHSSCPATSARGPSTANEKMVYSSVRESVKGSLARPLFPMEMWDVGGILRAFHDCLEVGEESIAGASLPEGSQDGWRLD